MTGSKENWFRRHTFSWKKVQPGYERMATRSELNLMKSKLVLIALGVLMGGTGLSVLAIWVRARPPREEPLREYRTLGPFQLTERSGRTVSDTNLRNKIVVADFFFASCSAQCLALSQRMAKIQQLTAGMDDVLLVSITVDPRSDTPEVLSRYADDFHASTNRWLFLTGERKAVYALVQEQFLQPVSEVQSASPGSSNGFIHSQKIALVDKHGIVRAYYDGMESGVEEKVIGAILQLRRE